MILLKNLILDSRKVDILVEGGKFLDIVPAGQAPSEAETVRDCEGLAVLPALYNTHTHAAMTLLRGYADDMALSKWLNEYIWPFEEKMTASDIRRGSAMALDEMVATGSVFFNDMYFDIEETIAEVQRKGMRAAIGVTVMENHSLAQSEQKKQFVREWKDPTGGKIQLVMAPHAIFTVGEQRLRETAAFARDNGLRLHIHVSETRGEVENCIKERGMSPVQYLDSIGFLGPDVIAAHCVAVDARDADILAERGVTIAHCPCSNMKLSSGIMPAKTLLEAGCRIALGTDGASSNNNLDLREEMKFASLLAKVGGDPEAVPASEVLKWATVNGAEAFGINAGTIEKGKEADFILVRLSNHKLQPCYNLVSNWVYSADSSCIEAVYCAGEEITSR